MQKHIVPAILGAAIALTAPTTTLRALDTPTPIVTVGCVNRASQSGSMTGTAVAAPATPDTAGAIANSATLTNQFMLNGATSPAATNGQKATAAAGQTATKPGSPASYVLDVARAVIEPHVGHRVEVTGTLLALPSTAPATPSALQGTTESRVQHIHVTSVRMIGEGCNAGAPESPESK